MNSYPFNSKNTTTILSTILIPPSFRFAEIETNPFRYGSKKSTNTTALLMKFFLAFVLGSLFFSSCKKDEFLTPPVSTASSGDTIIKNNGTTYYIATNGNDTTGNGSLSTPYRSLYKCSQVATSIGDSILMGAGTFIETHNCLISVGVSVRGKGILLTIIKGRYTTSAAIAMYQATLTLKSDSPGTMGNQSISYLTLDGDNYTGCYGISIKNRSKVKIHDVSIFHFNYGGVGFSSNGAFSEAIPAYETGNELYNSTITDCGSTHGTAGGNGLIFIACQDNMNIHDNILDARGRPAGQNGNIINAGGSHFKGFKYTNNKSYKLDDEVSNYGFHLEFWNTEGGMEISENEFHGGISAIDCGGKWSYKGTYAFAWSIYNNLFTPLSASARLATPYQKTTIIIESIKVVEKMLIYNNSFNYGRSAIAVYSPVSLTDLSVYSNTFNYVLYALNLIDYANVAVNFKRINFYKNLINQCNFSTSSHYDGTFSLILKKTGSVADVVNIYNNTFTSNGVVKMNAVMLSAGIKGSSNKPIPGGSLSNINIMNNIMAHFTNHGPIQIINNSGINGLHIEKNLSYNLANFNITPYFWPENTGVLTDYTYNDISTSNTNQQSPLFVSSSDYRLQPGSPARNAGQDVGLPYNESAPNIGAY